MKSIRGMSFFLVVFSFVGQVSLANPSIPIHYSKSLKQAENQARENSDLLKASRAMADAADEQSRTARGPLFPRLTIDGNYTYQTLVPSLTVGPLGNLQFGSHSNYSIGPALTYTLFDAGQARSNWRSFGSLAQSRHEESKNTDRQLTLNLRLTYFRVQRLLKDVFLTANSLKLAQAQSRDIHLRYQTGTASKLDQLSAQREVLNYRLRFQQSQSELASQFRELLTLTREETTYETSRPIPTELKDETQDGLESPTLVLGLDPLEATLSKLSERKFEMPTTEHPQIRALALSSEAAKLASESIRANHWPKFQFSAKAAWIYPNLVILENAQQNTFTVSMSLPLFEGLMTQSASNQKLMESVSADRLKDLKLTELARDWHKAQDILGSLHSQRKINKESIRHAEEIAKLTYQSYQAGRANYLDVQSTNLRALEVKATQAQLEEQTLRQMATLEFLSSH